VPFTGNFPNDSFISSNTFSPDDDGINDIWIIGDRAKPNTSKFAYDAFSIRMIIFGRNNVEVKWKELNNQFLNGFEDKWVNWDGSNNISNQNSYFVKTRFKNCYNEINIEQVITRVGGSLPPYISDSAEITNLNPQYPYLQIFPNPTNSNFKILIDNSFYKDYSVSLTDVTGKVIFTNTYNGNQTQQMIETNGLANGIYFVSIRCGDANKVEKLIIQNQN